MTDDDKTPPIQLAPAADDSLVAELRREPTREEQTLSELCEAHSGAYVPFHMFAKVALRTHRLWGWVSRKDRLYRRGKHYAWAAVVAAGANLGALGVYILHRHDEAVAAQEHAASEERINEIRRQADHDLHESLQRDIHELREKLLRMSGGVDPHTRKPDSSIYTSPNKVSTNQKDSTHDLVSNP